MKTFLLLTPVALITVAALAGCGARPAADNATAIDNSAIAEPTVAPTPIPTASYEEDERYRATSGEDQQFGPEATPDMIATYRQAMAKAHQFRPPLADKVPDKVRVILKTNRGPITVELDGKAAPLHVKSFVYLADKGFYDGTSFHRHADLTNDGKGFIIQGGDPLTKDANAVGYAGMGGPGYEVPREKNKLTHQKLVLAAARSQDPDSAGSQFYFTQGAVPFLDEGDGYTVFGKVVGGAEAALKLTKGDTLQSVKVEETKGQPVGQPAAVNKTAPKN